MTLVEETYFLGTSTATLIPTAEISRPGSRMVQARRRSRRLNSSN